MDIVDQTQYFQVKFQVVCSFYFDQQRRDILQIFSSYGITFKIYLLIAVLLICLAIFSNSCSLLPDQWSFLKVVYLMLS